MARRIRPVVTRLVTSFHRDNLIHRGLQPQRGADGRLAFVLPMGNAALPGIATADIGACAATLFSEGGTPIGRRIGIAGEHLSGAQMATALAHALGGPVLHIAMVDDAALASPGADFVTWLATHDPRLPPAARAVARSPSKEL